MKYQDKTVENLIKKPKLEDVDWKKGRRAYKRTRQTDITKNRQAENDRPTDSKEDGQTRKVNDRQTDNTKDGQAGKQKLTARK